VNPSDQLNSHKSDDEEIDDKQNLTITNSTLNVVTIEKYRMSYNFIRDLTNFLAQDVEDKKNHNVNFFFSVRFDKGQFHATYQLDFTI
jgi:hypothetical protein